MAADIAKRVKGAIDICQHDPLAIDRHPFHLTRGQFGHQCHRNKPFKHEVIPFPLPAMQGEGQREGPFGFC